MNAGGRGQVYGWALQTETLALLHDGFSRTYAALRLARRTQRANGGVWRLVDASSVFVDRRRTQRDAQRCRRL